MMIRKESQLTGKFVSANSLLSSRNVIVHSTKQLPLLTETIFVVTKMTGNYVVEFSLLQRKHHLLLDISDIMSCNTDSRVAQGMKRSHYRERECV